MSAVYTTSGVVPGLHAAPQLHVTRYNIIMNTVLGEAFFHLLFMGPLYLVVFSVLGVIIAAVQGVRCGIQSAALGFLKTLGSGVILLLVGALGNAIWAIGAWQKLYVSMDPVVTFVPFLPFGKWALACEWDGQTGGLLGNATMLEVQIFWWLTAILVWTSSSKWS